MGDLFQTFTITAALIGAVTADRDGKPAHGGNGTVPRASANVEARDLSASRLTWSAANCTLPDAPSQPIGQSAAALTTAFGRPISDARFVLGDEMTPARNTLLNRLPMHGNERVIVREMTWTKAGCDLTVWLTRRGRVWQAVQTARASADAEF